MIAEGLRALIVPIDKVRQDPRNARTHPLQNIESIKASLGAYGQRKPIVVNAQTDIIEAGNGLWAAAKALGWDEIAVLYVNDSDLTATGYGITDNRTAELAEWDMPTLKDLLEELDAANIDIDITGFTDKDLEDLATQFHVPEEGLTDDDAVPDDAPTVCQTGDLWVLGNHRLLCGDATKKEDVARLMDGQKADMVFTDPPYGIGLDTDYTGMPIRWNNKDLYQNKFSKVIGDEKEFDASFIIPLAKEVFLFGADYYAGTLPSSGTKGTWYVWDKREDEDGSSFDKMLGSPFEMCWGKVKRGKKFIRMRWASFLHSDATKGEQSKNRIHPTQKPIALAEWFIEKFSKKDTGVIDLFLGSGSTLIACEKLNRKCYGMEIDPHYCDVIIKRWEDYAGKKAIKDIQIQHQAI